ncbi:hypothetical protein [Actinoplanes sp. NPDC023714]|uniref:hypothetical protein n=1 Tax=Actinoplanes sp. NPDC023714 TaxID=3154322 RepID=UPI0033CDFDD9
MPGRRYNCRCGKKRYRDEASALAAAAGDREAHGGVVTVYRCPGGLAWHLTTRGFVPEALRTVGRRLAHELLTREDVDLDALFDERRRRRAQRCVAEMAAIGLVRVEESGLVVLDREGLARVVQIGLDACRQERAVTPARCDEYG